MARKTKKSATRSRRAVANKPKKTKTQQAAKPVDFAKEYRYVVSDLKRFGILAVAMFATLIVLALAIG